jgi:RNA polymerase sigma-70 factor (ECF subfamily)
MAAEGAHQRQGQESGIGAVLSAHLEEGALVERFWERIRLFACRRLPTAVEGEDVAQETIRRVLEALRQGRLRAPEALPAFVFETARNVCRQRQRSAMREGRAFDRLRGWRAHTDSGVDPLADMMCDCEQAAVRAALGHLADDDRELLRMSYYHALDTAEVARRLGATPGAVRVRRYRALHRLRALLQDHR